MFRLTRPTAAKIERVLESARAATPTFDHIGATRSEAPVPGFRYNSYSGEVGHGLAAFRAARDGLRVWAAHVGAGVSVTPPTEPLAAGATMVGSTRVGPLHVLLPCRVVSVVDEPRQFGFAYATLPGHPECGEESFIVGLAGDGTVTFSVSAHSRHAELLARLGAPVSQLVQRQTNNAYVAGLRAFVHRTGRDIAP